METPFFPDWRARLSSFGRSAQGVRQMPLPHIEKLFASLVPPGLLSQADEGENSRERVYSLRCTFWAFLWQVLNPGAPCREVVRQVQALFCSFGLSILIDEGTSAYCQARLRVPLELIERIRQAAADHAQKLLPDQEQRFHGWRTLLVDGSTVSMPDTPKNQAAYPQSKSQKPGCGFPLLKLVGLFSLSTGALLGYAKGNKNKAELPLFYRLRELFRPGDLLVADRGFATYVVMALLELLGVACLFRLHQARPHDMRKGIRLGKNDRLMVWSRPKQKPRYLPPALWSLVPKELTVRVLRVTASIPGFRTKTVTLVTTLSDAQAYPACELGLLYLRRWNIELWWRHIKTSMGMEVLRCKTPEMVHRELEMYLTGYNFIRCLMAEAAALHQQPLERISFKGAVDALRQYSPLISQASSRRKQNRLIEDLLRILALDLVPERPGRREPRAVKRRPKPYPLLSKPRKRFKEIRHQSRYRKNDNEK